MGCMRCVKPCAQALARCSGFLFSAPIGNSMILSNLLKRSEFLFTSNRLLPSIDWCRVDITRV